MKKSLKESVGMEIIFPYPRRSGKVWEVFDAPLLRSMEAELRRVIRVSIQYTIIGYLYENNN